MPTKTRSSKQKFRRMTQGTALQAIHIVKVGKERRLELRNRLNMTRDDFSRLVNVSVRALAAAESEETKVVKLQRPYTEVDRLYRALSEVIESKAIGSWFLMPNKVFDGLKPMELIERGEIDRLWDMVYRLQTGVPG